MKTSLDLADNQFLQIRYIPAFGQIELMICETPKPGKRAFRWRKWLPLMHLRNRHKTASKIKKLTEEIHFVIKGFELEKFN